MSSIVPDENKAMSDTWHFVEYFLRPMGPKLLDYLTLPNFRSTLGKMIGGSNKLLIVSKNGTFIVNENSGTWRNNNNVWLSNTHAVDAPITKTYTTYYGANYKYNKNTTESRKNEPVKKNSGIFFDIPSNPFTSQFLQKMSLNDIAAAVRFCSVSFIPFVNKQLGLKLEKPKTLQEVRLHALHIYCAAAQNSEV